MSVLAVRLLRGEGLPSADANGLSDPYALLTCCGEKKRSKVIYKTLNPEWNEEFAFVERATKSAKAQILELEVWDKDLIGNDFLGKAEVLIPSESQLAVGDKNGLELTLQLQGKKPHSSAGKVVLKLFRRPQSGAELAPASSRSLFNLFPSSLHLPKSAPATTPGTGQPRVVVVDVISARSLWAMDSNGFADPYVKISLNKKRKSSKTQWRTLTPEWRERFEWVVLDFGGACAPKLTLQLWDKDMVGSDDLMGTLEVDLSLLQVNLTDERWWPIKVHKKSVSSFFLGSKSTNAPPANAHPPEILLLITVADLFGTNTEAFKPTSALPGLVHVNLTRGEGMKAMDSNGLSDPFVVVEAGNQRLRSATHHKTLDPVWNQTLSLPIRDVFDTLIFRVYDEDGEGKYEHMGSLAIPILDITKAHAKPRWYALKNESLLGPAMGHIEMGLSLEYSPALAFPKLIKRRNMPHMHRPEVFKMKILKANAHRIAKIVLAPVPALTFAAECAVWKHERHHTLIFLVSWILFWHFIQIWHLPLAGSIAFLIGGINKFRRVKRSVDLDLDDDAYDDADGAEEEEADAIDQAEEAADEVDSDTEEAAAPPKLSRNYLRQLRALMKQLTTVAQNIQNLAGDVATFLERCKNIANWTRPFVSAAVFLGLVAGTVVLYFVPVRYLIMLVGVNRVVRSGLRKYHPAFKRPPHYKPIMELLELVGRAPDDVEREQTTLLPLPDRLKQQPAARLTRGASMAGSSSRRSIAGSIAAGAVEVQPEAEPVPEAAVDDEKSKLE